MADERLERALALKSKIDEHNAQIAVQKALYDNYVKELAELGLTPDTLADEIDRLTEKLKTLGAELDKELDEIEEVLS